MPGLHVPPRCRLSVLRFTKWRLSVLLAFSILLFRLPAALGQTAPPEHRPLPTGPYRIAGTVVSAKGGNALAGARVALSDVKNPQNTGSFVTSENGRFEFHVTAGKFSLQGSKRGYINSGYNQHDQYWTGIVTGADVETENLVFRLSPAAALTGKVFDESGEPVRNAQIAVYREDRFSGIGRILQVGSAQTDDQGAYEVTPLTEGTYFVSVTAQPWYAVHPVSARAGSATPGLVDRSLDVTYPVTYYGDATEAEDASPIPVRGGDRLEADIHLNPVPALHLIFHDAGAGRYGITAPVLQKPAFDGMENVPNSGIEQVAPGVYEMTGVAAGRYVVRMPDSPGEMKAPTEVDLTSGQELAVSSGSSTSKVKASVQVAGEATLPTGLQIVLRNNKGRNVAVAQADPKGEFNLQDIAPGKYEVLAGSPNKAYSVVRIASEAGTTSGHTLEVPAGASLAVSLSLAAGSVTVEGFAKRAGKAAPGVMVVLVPKDPEANLELFRRDQSDLDGSFSLQGVVPGSYTVMAIENGWDLDWAKPAVLERYLPHGQTIAVGEQAKGSVHLPKPVEVETK